MLVEAEAGDERVEIAQEGIEGAEQGRELVAEELTQGGEGLG